uniref:Uncharacterized protein n=1 Tax=Tanacetum cinerariifolium TaxID=118510 RepID=A0A6L2JVV5_TANCI|nr:hypothetical protein [Tanacetum cinerariifolium]
MEEDATTIKDFNAAKSEPTVFIDEKQEDIDQNVVAEQIQEKHLDNVKKYQSLKRKPIFVAYAKKNMKVYLKNMAGYKLQHFKEMTYDQHNIAIQNKENALWAYLTRLYEPNADDVFWKLQRYIHYPKKDYPLSNQVITLMLSSRLQVEDDTEVAREIWSRYALSLNTFCKPIKVFLRKIIELDANEDVTLVDMDADTQGRMEVDVTAVKDFNAAESEPAVFDDEEVTMSMAQTLIKMKAEKARILNEQMAKRLQHEETEQAAARERQEKEDLERAKVLQQQYDQKQEDINWNIVA